MSNTYIFVENPLQHPNRILRIVRSDRLHRQRILRLLTLALPVRLIVLRHIPAQLIKRVLPAPVHAVQRLQCWTGRKTLRHHTSLLRHIRWWIIRSIGLWRPNSRHLRQRDDGVGRRFAAGYLARTSGRSRLMAAAAQIHAIDAGIIHDSSQRRTNRAGRCANGGRGKYADGRYRCICAEWPLRHHSQLLLCHYDADE